MTTNGADEIFFILKTCLSRALKSGNKPSEILVLHKDYSIKRNDMNFLGACRVVKSTFEIIVHFLKEKVGIQNLSFLRSILQCKQILTVHKARVMFYASEKVEQSSLNGLNSFRTCLIALVEYAMVSAFFSFSVSIGVNSHY